MEQVAGVVLAGGLSRRMGGGDKGLRLLDGKPLIVHVIERLATQAAPLAINANGDPARFAAFGLPVIPDANADFAGPLAGVLAGLDWAKSLPKGPRFIATAACDTPFFPRNLVPMFLEAAGNAYPAIALAKSGGRIHPVFGLWPVALADDLRVAVADGVRKVLDWTGRHICRAVEFPDTGAHDGLGDPFFNANTPEELARASSFAREERR